MDTNTMPPVPAALSEEKLAKLDAILSEYREGKREFPTYAELSALLRG